MIKKARVIFQKPSLAKKGMYITTLEDRFGQLKVYTSRKLEPQQEVVVSVRQGAANDPLAVTILNKKQEENWLATHTEGGQE